MTRSGAKYLNKCFIDFRQTIEKKYGRPFDLPAIEKSVRHLCREIPLSYSDLAQFESPQHWWFEKFWVFPPEHQLSPGLKRRKFNFWGLPKHEGGVIASLHEVFRSIELVSIILRFVRPENYGIFSPPVERVLDVRRGSDAVETYLNYLEDLRAIAKEYRFARVADADMALWVVHERCYGTLTDRDVENSYFADPFMLQLRAKNLLSQFFRKHSYLELSTALLSVNPELAAQIAGIEFERKIRIRGYNAKDANVEDLDLKALIDHLQTQRLIDPLTAGRWQAARKTRNKAIHGSTALQYAEVKRLLEILNST